MSTCVLLRDSVREEYPFNLTLKPLLPFSVLQTPNTTCLNLGGSGLQTSLLHNFFLNKFQTIQLLMLLNLSSAH